MSKWEPAYKPKKQKPRNPPRPPELCRIIPPRLARAPDILEWLTRKQVTLPTIRIAMELKIKYRELAELFKSKNLDC